MTKRFVGALFASTCLTVAGPWVQTSLAAAAPAVPVVADGIGGVVTSTKGPEAGVWVIAETHDLPSRIIKIVVTDDQGRFMLPQLPTAKYEIWVRGYGLVDSKRVEGAPGKNLNLTAVVAPDAKSAAEYYPANYWLSLIKPPAPSEFPGTGPKGNGISPALSTQQMWIDLMKNTCMQCHQQGDKVTRTLTDSSPESWAERIIRARPDDDPANGLHGKDYANNMKNAMTRFGRTRGLAMWADWTQRIAKGALPAEMPPRPQGVERNLVLTSWDWAGGRYVHDEVSTDRHDPTVNANGPIYGVTFTWGFVETTNPVTFATSEFGYKVNLNKNVEILPPDKLPDAGPHNPMLDSKGKLWLTDRGHYGPPYPNEPPHPDKMPYCTDASNKYAKYWPQPGRTTDTAVIWDPATKKIDGIPMCNGIHHLMMNSDRKTMVFSGGDNRVVSWVDTDVWDQSHDAGKAMGWCPMVLDTNSTKPSAAAAPGDVTIIADRTQWNEPASPGRAGGGEEASGETVVAKPIDPKKDTRIEGFLYGVDADIHDGSMWFAKTGPWPTGAVRFHPGASPPETCHTEYYEPPKLADGKNYAAFNGRGISVDSRGIAWIAYGSGQFGRFDRSKCTVMSGPTVADGQHCREGWELYDSPGPRMQGVNSGSADHHYLNWVDLHDTLGLGRDMPILAGSNSDSLLAFDDKAKKYIVMRVPYPKGFHTRGMDGRIDDPSKGWKGKGVFATYASGPVWHQEGGEEGSGPNLVKFQIRPDPLAY